jgi:dihydrolipoamide dehydrogenase
MNLEATINDVHHSIHAHPTLSEALGEAALATLGRAIHI